MCSIEDLLIWILRFQSQWSVFPVDLFRVLFISDRNIVCIPRIRHVDLGVLFQDVASTLSAAVQRSVSFIPHVQLMSFKSVAKAFYVFQIPSFEFRVIRKHAADLHVADQTFIHFFQDIFQLTV